MIPKCEAAMEKVVAHFLSFWLDPSRPLIKWYDPFCMVDTKIRSFYLCVYWFGVWIIVIPFSKPAFLKNDHPKMRDSLEGHYKSINVAYSSTIPMCQSHRSSLTKPSPWLLAWSNLSTCHQDFLSKASVEKTQHLDISSTPFHQKETSLNCQII